MKNRINTGVGLSFISLLLLGIMPIISNSRPMKISALNFSLYLSFWQLIFAAPVFFVEYQKFNRGLFDVSLSSTVKKRILLIILSTGMMFGLSTFLYVLAMERAGTVSASIAIQAYPLFVILWETLFLKKRKSKRELFFTFSLVFSLYYLGTNGTWQIKGLSYWILIALCVPFIWSVAHVWIKEIIDQTPITPAQITFFRVLISAIVILCFMLFTDGLNPVLNVALYRDFQIYAASMGLVYYLELINWFYAVKFVDVSIASSITTPWPAVTLILAVTFLNESIEIYQVLALIFVSICLYGILFSGKKKRKKELSKPHN